MNSYYRTGEKNNGGIPNYYQQTTEYKPPTTFLTKPRKSYWDSPESCIIPTYHKPGNLPRQRYGNLVPPMAEPTSYMNGQHANSYSTSQNVTFASVMENGKKDSYYGLQQVYTSHISGPTVLLVEPSARKGRNFYRYLFFILLALFLLTVGIFGWQRINGESPVAVPQFNYMNKVKIITSMDEDAEASLENVDQ